MNPSCCVRYQGYVWKLAFLATASYVNKVGSCKPEMLSLNNHYNGRCARWCALVVLLAVCSLTISVATRYNSPETTTNSAHKSLQKHCSEEPSRQRLEKSASTWAPPIVISTAVHAPSLHFSVAYVGPEIPNPSFVSSLYYRPPPFAFSV